MPCVVNSRRAFNNLIKNAYCLIKERCLVMLP
jgi:hypothetical protein